MIKNLLQIVLIFLFSIVFFKHTAYCDIKLFLQSKIITNNDGLVLKDVAVVEGNNSDIEKIKNIQIDKTIYSDGYIDKKEILSLLKNNTEDTIFIFGNAIRILTNDPYKNNTENDATESVIKKGDSVNIIIKKNGISVIVRGISLNEGKTDEEIFVKLEKKTNSFKFIKGKIKNKDLIEVNL